MILDFVEKREDIILAVSIILFAWLRIPYLFQESLWNDETVYMWMGQKILENPAFLLTSHPAHHSYGYLFSILTAVLNLFLPIFYSARIVTLLFSVMNGVLLYLIGKKMMNKYAGLAAMLLLGFNGLHIFITDRALLDVPITAMFTAMMAALVYFDPDSIKSGILLGATTLLSILTKTSGMLTVPIVGLALIAMYPDIKAIRKEGIIACFATLVASGLFLVINNLFHFGRISSEPIGDFLRTIVFSGSPTFYIENASLIYSTPLFILALIGMYMALSGDRESRAVVIATLVYFLFFSFVISEKVPRYGLPILPGIIILAVCAVNKVVEKLELPSYAILAILVLGYFAYQPANSLLSQRAITYTGFQETGELVAELDGQENFETIYAQSVRQIRTFSGIDFKNDGGRISGLPVNFSDLENQSNILLQIDVWEYSAPSWVYPLDQAKLDAILAANFSLTHAVQRDYPTQQGLQKVPVGFLLVR
ncbi:phospholipid carrier-dependent glycosyltransferase [Candidatus Bathyarchaeota archaeon]|nr:phospholipid carrier-dependent glycosyltransferase [Candidatus Bathyarchaeota archaeon]